MPISRVMNNPDGSTPVPPVGGGDSNGTLATSIFGAGTGTGADQISVPRHFHAQTTFTGIPGALAPLSEVALDELEETTQQQDSAKAELAEAREEEAEEASNDKEEVEEWLAENRAITDPPAAKEPEPKAPRQRPPRHK